MSPLLRFWRATRRNEAVAATEFALLAPLLLLFYAAVFETGRGWLAYRKFAATVENAARYAARFPEFESRVRTRLPLIVREALAPLSTRGLNLTLTSVVITNSAPVQVFSPYNFYGNASGVSYTSLFSNSAYAEGESVIVVTGTYSYSPIFLSGVVPSITFTRSIALNPFFSRSYTYQAGTSDFGYYNVR